MGGRRFGAGREGGGGGEGRLEAGGVLLVAGLEQGEAAVDDEVVGVERLDEARHLARPGGRHRREAVEAGARVGLRGESALGAADGRGEDAARGGEELDAQLPAQDGGVLAVGHPCGEGSSCVKRGMACDAWGARFAMGMGWRLAVRAGRSGSSPVMVLTRVTTWRTTSL